MFCPETCRSRARGTERSRLSRLRSFLKNLRLSSRRARATRSPRARDAARPRLCCWSGCRRRRSSGGTRRPPRGRKARPRPRCARRSKPAPRRRRERGPRGTRTTRRLRRPPPAEPRPRASRAARTEARPARGAPPACPRRTRSRAGRGPRGCRRPSPKGRLCRAGARRRLRAPHARAPRRGFRHLPCAAPRRTRGRRRGSGTPPRTSTGASAARTPRRGGPRRARGVCRPSPEAESRARLKSSSSSLARLAKRVGTKFFTKRVDGQCHDARLFRSKCLKKLSCLLIFEVSLRSRVTER
mmetsp:Transcript_13686/g.57536  ORF Transcript_13686/g.57536 Transcript_13686/m.57536 type:complete len:299 (-) Transcript_13686:1535-2431(-)